MAKHSMWDWLDAHPHVKEEIRKANNETVRYYGNELRRARANVAEAEKRLELHRKRGFEFVQAEIDLEAARFMDEWWNREFGEWIDEVTSALEATKSE